LTEVDDLLELDYEPVVMAAVPKAATAAPSVIPSALEILEQELDRDLDLDAVCTGCGISVNDVIAEV
jgi:hypothetical protein